MARGGDWTEALHDAVSARPTTRPVWVYGPLLSPYATSFKTDNVVCVASGIGITPALSVFAQQRETSEQRVHLIWICRDPSLVEFHLNSGASGTARGTTLPGVPEHPLGIWPNSSRGASPRPVSTEYPRASRGVAATRPPRNSRVAAAATRPPRNIHVAAAASPRLVSLNLRLTQRSVTAQVRQDGLDFGVLHGENEVARVNE